MVLAFCVSIANYKFLLTCLDLVFRLSFSVIGFELIYL